MKCFLLLALLAAVGLVLTDDRVIFRVKPITAKKYRKIVGKDGKIISQGRVLSGLSSLTSSFNVVKYINRLFGSQETKTVGGYPLCTINAMPEARQLNEYTYENFEDIVDPEENYYYGGHKKHPPVINCVLVLDDHKHSHPTKRPTKRPMMYATNEPTIYSTEDVPAGTTFSAVPTPQSQHHPPSYPPPPYPWYSGYPYYPYPPPYYPNYPHYPQPAQVLPSPIEEEEADGGGDDDVDELTDASPPATDRPLNLHNLDHSTTTRQPHHHLYHYNRSRPKTKASRPAKQSRHPTPAPATDDFDIYDDSVDYIEVSRGANQQPRSTFKFRTQQ